MALGAVTVGIAATFFAGQAHAADGYWVEPAQEKMVMPGMSSADVLQVLGRPGRNVKYRNQPGPTYTYGVLGHNEMLFDVDFDADGKVAAATERMDMSRGGGGRGGHGKR